VAEPELADKLTLAPPNGAATVRVTVPVALVPPVTVEGDTDKPPRTARLLVAGLTVKEVSAELDDEAVMMTL